MEKILTCTNLALVNPAAFPIRILICIFQKFLKNSVKILQSSAVRKIDEQTSFQRFFFHSKELKPSSAFTIRIIILIFLEFLKTFVIILQSSAFAAMKCELSCWLEKAADIGILEEGRSEFHQKSSSCK